MAIQQIWLEQDFDQVTLKTICGKQIKIGFSGWYNSASGPEFREERLKIEKQYLLVAVEIHVNSSGWNSYHREGNPNYNEFVLHVVLYHNGHREIKHQDGRIVPELEIAPLLSKEPSSYEIEAKNHLKKLSELPERCGIVALERGTETLKKILGHAAERRIQEKTETLLKRWDEQDPEELLFQLLFKSLGYTPYAQVLEELAKRLQFRELRPLFRQSQRTTRTLVLPRWFGSCGLFSKIMTIADPKVRREFQQWKAAWQELPEHPQISGKISQVHRPQNSTDRRLLCMFHHLYRIANDGLLKSWLVVSRNLSVFFLKKKSCGCKLWLKQNCYFLLRIGEFGGNTLFWVNRNRLIPHNLLRKSVKL